MKLKHRIRIIRLQIEIPFLKLFDKFLDIIIKISKGLRKEKYDRSSKN